MIEDPFADDRQPDPAWETGTALDEFLPIYRALAQWTDRHGPFSQDQVDRMDISVVAVIMGVDGGSSLAALHAQWVNEYDAAMAQFATAGEAV